jgi:hypothetical protein
MKIFGSFLFTLAATLLLLQCGTGKSAQKPDVVAPAGAKYKLTPFAPSTLYADASIVEMDFERTKLGLRLGEGSTFKLGEQTPDTGTKMCANSTEGQHVHVIVDDKPYDAKYKSSFEYKIPDGEHYLMTFLSRSYHESIKNGKAHKAVKGMFKDNSMVESSEITNPMLFYSRPKGNYVGVAQTQKVMLDFFLLNCQLGSGYLVKADINGESHIINAWQPYYIEGLPMGENKIVLTLYDPQNKIVNNSINPVTRTFTLADDNVPSGPK